MLEKLNTEQQKAVKNIVEKVDKLPFILFGPPGNGIIHYNFTVICVELNFLINPLFSCSL